MAITTFKKIRGRQVTLGRNWTTKEIDHVRFMAGRVKSRHLALALKRSYESLRQMAKRQNISLRRH